jgi:hypothetical protein
MARVGIRSSLTPCPYATKDVKVGLDFHAGFRLSTCHIAHGHRIEVDRRKVWDMPWIKVIQESEAKGKLKEAYARMHEINAAYGESLGGTQPHPVTPPELASLNPLSMLYGRQFMMHIMRGPSRLTPAQREMIATVTSLAAHCRY